LKKTEIKVKYSEGNYRNIFGEINMKDLIFRLKKYRDLIHNSALVICTIISIYILAILLTSGKNPSENVYFLGFAIKQNSINGVYQGIITFMSVVMVCVNTKVGRAISNILILIAILSDAFVCIISHTSGPMPGILNGIICLIYLNIVAVVLTQFEKRGMEDAVTKLLNHRGVMKNMKKAIKGKKTFNTLYIHISDPRTVIDQMSYEFTELMYIEIANRIRSAVGEKHIIGKLEGNDYVVLLPYGESVEEASQKIISFMDQEIHLEREGVSNDVWLPAHIGVATFPNHGKTRDDLIHNAGMAAYNAYIKKEKHPLFYNEKMAETRTGIAAIEEKIHQALNEDSFYLVYQPQYYLDNKKLRGFETLIRCKFQDGTAMYPSEFIPVAEKSELITAIDGYVIGKAIKDFKEIINDKKIILSVNVSAKTMADDGFVDFVKEVLVREGFSAECLEIEITEYSFVESMDQTIANIKGLKDLGVMIALDDFGTGYTSLSQLLNLPIDLLKIDKSLIDDIEGNKLNQDFVDSVIYMGHLMECEVISEGVETVGQLEVLKSHECDFVQGYVWGKPMEEQDAKELALA